MSFYTTEEQLYELFGKCGDVKRIVMGLDKFKRTPCGFCFIEFYTREDGENAMAYINSTRLDDRIIRTDWDAGFVEGRQYGRGKNGGQVRPIPRHNTLLMHWEGGALNKHYRIVSCLNSLEFRIFSSSRN